MVAAHATGCRYWAPLHSVSGRHSTRLGPAAVRCGDRAVRPLLPAAGKRLDSLLTSPDHTEQEPGCAAIQHSGMLLGSSYCGAGMPSGVESEYIPTLPWPMTRLAACAPLSQSWKKQMESSACSRAPLTEQTVRDASGHMMGAHMHGPCRYKREFG